MAQVKVNTQVYNATLLRNKINTENDSSTHAYKTEFPINITLFRAKKAAINMKS
jgi:hypothetical protein